MQIIQGIVKNLSKETYNQDTNEIITNQTNKNIDDFYLMNRYEFELNNKTFYYEHYGQDLENGDEVIICFDKDFYVNYMINNTKNWENTKLENPIKKKDMIIIAFFFIFGVYLAIGSTKVMSYLFLLFIAFFACLIIGYFHYKEYKEHKFFIAKMKEMKNQGIYK